MKKARSLLGMIVFALLSSGWQAVAQGAMPKQGELDRTVLPIPVPRHPPIKELDVRKAKVPPRFEAKAPNLLKALHINIRAGVKKAKQEFIPSG